MTQEDRLIITMYGFVSLLLGLAFWTIYVVYQTNIRVEGNCTIKEFGYVNVKVCK